MAPGLALIAPAIISSAALLVSGRTALVALLQVAAATASPLAWPSVWILVFSAARHGRLPAAAATMGAAAAASIAAVLVVMPVWLGISPPAQVLLIAVAIAGLSVSVFAGFVSGYRHRRAADAEMIRMRERDDLVRRVEQARSAERERLTSELHDTLGNRIALLRAILESDDDPAAQLEHARVHVRKAGDDLRALVSSRVVESRGDVGPLDAVREVVAEAREAGLTVSLTLDSGLEHIPRRQQQLVLELFREGITNALKYASPGLVVAAGAMSDGAVNVTISSPTAHTAPRRSEGSGWGLTSLTERALSLHGVLEYGVTADRFELHLRLPIEPPR